MSNDKEVSSVKKASNRFLQYLRKNGFSIVMIIALGVMLVSPDAKSFLLAQLMKTGLFNASINQKESVHAQQVSVDFSFLDENGTVQNTSSLRGKVVFINFWASWCPPCRAEFPSIETLYAKYRDHPDIFFLMINEDNNQVAAKEYLRKENSALPLYRAHSTIPQSIFSGTLPTTVVLDKKGKIRFHHTGFANYASAKFGDQLNALMSQ
ncbi:MAG: redoxin family protein [Sphingobacterium sp.]